MEFYGFSSGGSAGEMAGFAPPKVKRKDLEEVYDDFSEFSLSSPARKIRRLDTELPPIMEEEEPAAAPVFGQPLPMEEQLQSSSKQLTNAGLADAEPLLPSNKERAIVLYKPVSAPLLDSPSSSNVCLTVDPDMIAGFKGQAFWRGRPNIVKTRSEEAEASTGNRQAAVSSCLAVVPWMPSQLPDSVNAVTVSGGKDSFIETVKASQDSDGALMDIEVEGGQADGVMTPGMAVTEGLQHWQQHCMTPQVGPSESTPLMWSWG